MFSNIGYIHVLWDGSEKDYYVAAGQMEGWTKSGTTIPGEYAPISGSSASGNKWIGWKVMQDATLSVEFVENEELTNTKESYAGARNIWWSSSLGKWVISAVIGTSDTLVGYWSCSTLIGTYTRTFTGEGDAPTPETYSITVKEYRALSTTHDAYPIYMGQVATWL